VTSPLAGSHEAMGVRWSGSDPRIPRNYGEPEAEYAAARDAVAIVDRADRRYLRVYGRDPARMIQGLITNDVGLAGPGRAIYAAVLTAKGRMVADVRVLRRAEELLLETDAAAAGPLAEHLKRFVPPLFARFEDVSGGVVCIGAYGPAAGNALRAVLDVTLPDDAAEDTAMDAVLDDIAVTAVATAWAGGPGWDVLCPPDAAETLWRRLANAGARPMGHATLDVLRIEAGRPRWGAELGESTIPLEAGLRERAISETKGCYTGQEVIVRILHRGHVNWHLRGVLLGDTSAPPADTALCRADDGRTAGRITSAAWSPRHGQTIALAYVRREVEPPAELRLGAADGANVRVVALPFPAP
jgi:folate-binding protein YgfZ